VICHICAVSVVDVRPTYGRPACDQCRRTDPKYHEKNVAKRRAHNKVAYAIKRGDLAKLDGSLHCVDCGNPAERYDHREYAKPLSVEPVCHKCNLKRGPAIDSYAAAFPKKWWGTR
jgi:hypothetical protein